MPAPVGPTIAIIRPGAMSSDMPSMSGTASLYLKLTSSNCTAPRDVAVAFAFSESGVSSGSSSNSNTRSADTIVSWMMLAMPLSCVIGIVELPAVLDERLHVADR